MIITGYKIDRIIDEENQFSLGISEQSEGRFPLKLKFAERNRVSFERLLQLKNNHSLLAGLDHPLIPRAIDFRTDKTHVALITEYIPGKSVKDLTDHGPLDIEKSLRIGIDLCEISAYLIKNQIIHQAISPKNVIVGEDEHAYLINFDKATNREELEQEKVPVRLLPYELDYCAPEQTGRVNRLIDFRTDLYGIGMILYQALSGKKPFESADALELVHSQIAKMPVPISEIDPAIPKVLSDIVQKLLAKNAEDRYQSASGLARDLKKCLAALNQGKTPDFIPGKDDRADRFIIPQRLIGREKEIDTLVTAFKSVIQGPASLAVVAGYSGVGKSALIEHVADKITEEGGLLVRGKSDQIGNVPYGPLVEASRELFNFILKEDEQGIRYWRERIIREVGENLALLTVGLPGLDRIVGAQSMPEDLAPSDAESRYDQVVFNFLQAISTPERPLCIFLDDLQWSDQATLDILEKIVTRQAHTNLLFIISYRDNEVNEDHPLTILLSRIHDRAIPFENIHLRPLSKENIFELMAEIFNSRSKNILSLSEIIFNKTYGNPFFTIQLLKNLYDERIIFFDRENATWVWDSDSLSKLKISDNVVDLMLKKINTLPRETRDVVCIAAPIGSSFQLKVHAGLCGLPEREIISHLFPAVQEKMIQLNSAWFPYMLNDNSVLDERELAYLSTLSFSFIHDRVQQAAYSLIPEEERKNLHLKLGRILYESAQEEEDWSHIYDIVYHLNQSAELITDPRERLQLIELNLKAGAKSNRSNAFENAIIFLEKGISLLPENSWEEDYELCFDLYYELSWAKSIVRPPEESESGLQILIDNARNASDRLLINTRRVSLYTKQGDFHSVIRETRASLSEFGIRFPEKKLGLQLGAMFALVWTTLKLKWHFNSWSKLEKIKSSDDPTHIRINNLLVEAGVASYSTSQELMVLTMLKVLNRSLRYGATESSPWSFQAYAVIAGSFFKWYKAGYEIGRSAIALGERVCGNLQRSRLPFVQTAFLTHWRQHIAKDLPVFFETYKKTKANGDLTMAYNSLVIHTLGALGAGYPLGETMELIESKEKQMNGFEGAIGLYLQEPQKQFVKALLGLTKDPGTMEDDDFMEVTYLADEKSSGNSEAYFYNYNLQLCFYTRNLDKAASILPKATESIPFVIGLYMVNELEFFICMVRFELLRKGAKDQQRTLEKEIKKQLNIFRVWAKNAPENFQHQYDLLQAEWFYWKGDRQRSTELYKRAMDGSKEQGFLQVHAICLEQAGRFYRNTGMIEIGNTLIKKAWAGYENWGAVGLKNNFQDRYPDLDLYESNEILSPVDESLRMAGSGNILEEILDFNSLLKSSQTLSSAIKFEELLQNMMQILMENAAAQKMALILDEGGVYELTAWKTVDMERAAIVQRPIQENADLVPVQIINYCFHTRDLLVLENTGKNRLFADDPYVEKGNVLSVLCFPIVFQNSIIGLIYLENNLIEGAFTAERIEVLNLLSAQIAVSITNAQLFENLEKKVDQRTREIRAAKDEIEKQKREIEQEKEKSDDLLLNILPERIADELKTSGSAKARQFEDVSVLFVDIVGFTLIAQKMSPAELVKDLDYYFKAFDDITAKHGIEKIKTIGDAFMAASGVPEPGTDNAKRMIRATIEMREFVEMEKERRIREGRKYFETRFGIHTGPVVAGVVGHHKFAFDIWGDTVNTAARLQSYSQPGKVNISEATYEKVKDQYPCTYRGEIETKHKGMVKMFFVD